VTATLMTYLPTLESDQLATKAYLVQLKHELKHELLAEVHRELTIQLAPQTRTLVFSVVFSLFGAIAGIGGLALALSRLLPA
jgi:hypothetical protein